MSKYQRPPGSVDVKINEIPDGAFRVKIIGTIVSLSSGLITINDGTGTVMLKLYSMEFEGLTVGQSGRFICEISKSGTEIEGKLIAMNSMDRDTIERYWKLVGIERRIPKNTDSD